MSNIRYTLGGDYDPNNSDSPVGNDSSLQNFSKSSPLRVYYETGSNNVAVVNQFNTYYTLYSSDFTIALTKDNAGFFYDFSDRTGATDIPGGSFGDVIRTGSGNDVLDGAGGDDVLEGGAGADTIDGGSGNNTLSYEHSTRAVFVSLGANAAFGGDATGDTFTNIQNLSGSAFNDVLFGDGGTNTLIGGTGNDVLDGGAGFDVLRGGTGDDTYYVDNTGDLTLEAAGQGIDTVYSTVDFALAANQSIEFLRADAGSSGLALLGNALVQSIYGGAGNDSIGGGGGADSLFGGAGDDTYFVENAGVTIIEAVDGGTDTLRSSISATLSANLENLVLTGAGGNGTGNALANTITGNAGNNVLDGKGGADTLIGGLGNDTYYVDNAGDVIVELAGQGSDKVLASVSYTLADNVERLELTSVSNVSGTGNNGINTIIGSTGANTLTGLGGRDTLTGGAGRDTFVFASLSDSTVASTGRDTITDFTQADTDRIDLRGIDANGFLDGDQAFKFIGTNAFSGVAGQLRFEASGSDTLVSADVDGNSVADFAILLTGQIALTSGNFLL